MLKQWKKDDLDELSGLDVSDELMDCCSASGLNLPSLAGAVEVMHFPIEPYEGRVYDGHTCAEDISVGCSAGDAVANASTGSALLASKASDEYDSESTVSSKHHGVI